MTPRVRVGPLPVWVPANRLLGAGDWISETEADGVYAHADLERTNAADLAARLRGVVIAGKAVTVQVVPALSRALVRTGRLDEARRQRDRSPGFTRAGVHIDEDARLGLTPEQMALDLGHSASGRHVIDACCGAGGNAIGFARAGCSVTAIEIDATRLAMAKHNARIYGVADRIEWVHDDARNILPRLSAGNGSLWFVDVPWQDAPSDDSAGNALQTLLHELVALRPAGQHLWAKVPAAFDPATIASAQPEAHFGVAPGDSQRIKFLILKLNT